MPSTQVGQLIQSVPATIDAALLGYLDPGAGSMLLQVLLGGVAALGVVARLAWHRFRRSRKTK